MPLVPWSPLVTTGMWNWRLQGELRCLYLSPPSDMDTERPSIAKHSLHPRVRADLVTGHRDQNMEARLGGCGTHWPHQAWKVHTPEEPVGTAWLCLLVSEVSVVFLLYPQSCDCSREREKMEDQQSRTSQSCHSHQKQGCRVVTDQGEKGT